MSARRFASLAVALLAGCAIPLRNGDNAPALARKVVTQKLLPDTLVAADGTRCVTTAGKFRKTALQSPAWCIWLVPSRFGTAAAARQ